MTLWEGRRAGEGEGVQSASGDEIRDESDPYYVRARPTEEEFLHDGGAKDEKG